MDIFYLGHASFLIKGKDISFVIDPYRDNSVPNLRFPRVSANYVFKSHDHFDHNAIELVNIIKSAISINYRTITVPHDHHNGEHRGLNLIHVFNIDGYKIVHLGDLGCIPSLKVLEELKNTDVLLAPINGHFTISSLELLEILKEIKPRLVIPMHYYMDAYHSGYPDGGEINEFKRLVGNYKEVNDYRLKIDESVFDNNVVIFNKYMLEE